MTIRRTTISPATRQRLRGVGGVRKVANAMVSLGNLLMMKAVAIGGACRGWLTPEPLAPAGCSLQVKGAVSAKRRPMLVPDVGEAEG